MLPLRDENPTTNFPVVTVALICINSVVFLYQLNLPARHINHFIRTWGFVPARLSGGNLLWAATTAFSSMFLHGGLVHVAGNMLYLWVFGDNIEDELGPAKFILFYLLAGLAGLLLQFTTDPTTTTPQVGASAAIAGVMGAYILLYPRARILTVLFLFIFIRILYLPAWLLIGFWIFIQMFHGAFSLGLQTGGGVAWFAHIGGFVAGAGMINFWTLTSRKKSTL